MKAIVSAMLALILASCTTVPTRSSESELKRTVASIHKMLQSKQYDSVVQALFGLSDPDEITKAVQHLQRPRCLQTYNALFAALRTLEPDIQHAPLAFFEIEKLDVTHHTYQDMKVMFYHVGNAWRFNDPSFDKKLGRKLIDDLREEIEQDSSSVRQEAAAQE